MSEFVGNQPILEPIPEHNTTDPKPRNDEASEEDKAEYLDKLSKHVNEWCENQKLVR